MPRNHKNSAGKRHLLYEIFNPKGNGNGLTKEEIAQPRTVGRFFRFYSTNFNMMFALNIFAFLGNFPILFGLYALTGNLNFNTTAPTSSLFAPLRGVALMQGNNPVTAALFGVHGIQETVSLPTTATYVFYSLTALIIFTFGIVNLSSAYIMRNIVKGDPTLFVSDIRYSVKRNWKQGMLLGAIDLIFLVIIGYDLVYFRFAGSHPLFAFLLGAMAIIAMLYSMMRYYMYLLLVTFDLSIWKIFKNAFIFSILGFKRNIAAFLASLLIWAIDYYLLIVIFPIGIILPVMFLVSLTQFMGIYAAYPKIKEIMIDPYYVSDDVGAKLRSEAENDEPEHEIEPIFKDRG